MGKDTGKVHRGYVTLCTNFECISLCYNTSSAKLPSVTIGRNDALVSDNDNGEQSNVNTSSHKLVKVFPEVRPL